MSWWKRHEADETGEVQRLVRHAAELHGVPTDEVVHAVLNEPDDALDDGRLRSRAGVWITLGVVGMVFGLVIVGLMYLARSADQAGPIAQEGMEELQKSIEPTPPVNPTLTGTHISFTYPAVFDVIAHPANWPNTTERYTLSSKGDYRKSIQVYVESVAAPQFDSGYLYRSRDSNTYSASHVSVMGEPAVVMVKDDSSERTLYWMHGGSLVIMSATGVRSELTTWMSVITSSLRWIP